MPTTNRRPAVAAGSRLALYAGLLAIIPAAAQASEPESLSDSYPAPCWTITSRVISQEQARGQVWQVDYVLRLDSGPEVLTSANVNAEIDGWVSNSRVSGHATPRRSSLSVPGPVGQSESEVIAASDKSRQCRERASLHVWAAQTRESPLHPLVLMAASSCLAPAQVFPIVVSEGNSVRVRLRLEHDHFLYGPYEPLLGMRTLTMRMGNAQVCDVLPLDQELRPARSLMSWPLHEPTPDRLDSEVFVSAPHSLHLEAHVPGNGLYRFTGPVRYASQVKLSYWYLVAPGTEGEARERLTQFKQGTLPEGASVFQSLSSGEQEHFLTTEGRWVHVERLFRTEPEATSLSLEFRLSGEIGELWLDDVALEPVGEGPAGP